MAKLHVRKGGGIYHITTESSWDSQKSNSFFIADSLSKEGFIYCADKHQVLPVLNRKYKGRKDVMVLEIDESMLTSEVIYEDTSGKGERHPHVYGMINMTTIIGELDMAINEDGEFEIVD